MLEALLLVRAASEAAVTQSAGTKRHISHISRVKRIFFFFFGKLTSFLSSQPGFFLVYHHFVVVKQTGMFRAGYVCLSFYIYLRQDHGVLES